MIIKYLHLATVVSMLTFFPAMSGRCETPGSETPGGQPGRGEIVDRIVATVNGHAILQSDWEDAVHYEAFIAGHSPEQLTFTDRKAALDRLIDQELLRQQIRSADFQHASDQEIAARIQEIRRQYPAAESNSGWHAALTRYGLTEKELERRVALQLD